MTIAEALTTARTASVRVYERKSALMQAMQQVQTEMAECDAEFLRLDGEIRVLTALSSQEARNGQ